MAAIVRGVAYLAHFPRLLPLSLSPATWRPQPQRVSAGHVPPLPASQVPALQSPTASRAVLHRHPPGRHHRTSAPVKPPQAVVRAATPRSEKSTTNDASAGGRINAGTMACPPRLPDRRSTKCRARNLERQACMHPRCDEKSPKKTSNPHKRCFSSIFYS